MTRFLSHIRTMDTNVVISKFRGGLLGGLIGDCCGAPYEGELLEKADKLVLQKGLNKLEGPMFKAPQKSYTDDTSMTVAVSKCLIANKSLPPKELAGYYCQSYFNNTNTNRGFGSGVPKVLLKLRQTKLENPLEPAKEQFNGSGSHGNGAAMRVAPVGLFCFNKPTDFLIDLAKQSAVITHTNRLGINGAVLQALAIQYCVKEDPKNFDRNAFIEHLKNEVKVLESDEEFLKLDTKREEYLKQITQVEKLLNKDPTDEEVLNRLGHTEAALWSVPTALYCFLKAQDNITGIQTDNPFRRTIQYAITLGGDTDTIASMAGSLAGALYGDEIINENLIQHCEENDEILNLANDLYKASV